jgi:hypothetical protein
MFAYNPTVNDRSGEFLAAGQVGAAQTNAQMMVQLGQDIGGALASIGGIYAEGQQVKSDAKIYGDLIKFAAPVLGDNKGEMLKAYNGMDTRDQANFGRLLFGGGTFATMSQGYNFGQRIGVQQGQPFVNAGLDNARDLAAGKGTYTPTGGGMAPVEPPLPVADDNLPAVGGAPMTAPSSLIPGGQSSIDAINRDRQRRGLPPIK